MTLSTNTLFMPLYMLVTLETTQSPNDWLKAEAFTNMPFILMTLEMQYPWVLHFEKILYFETSNS